MKRDIVALVGVGGIGFRHFQSLLTSDRELTIYLVDTSRGALSKAEEYARQEAPKEISICYENSIDALPNNIDILIIATSSLVRKSLFMKITKRAEVRFVIFEKFLFPCITDYMETETQIINKGMKAFVNCPSRLYPGYINLKNLIKEAPSITIHSTGSNWGISCNAIHILDTAAFLMNAYDGISCDASQLDSSILNSKRDGYIEFTGKLICRIADRATIVMESYADGDLPYTNTIFAGDSVFIVSESDQTMIISDATGVRKESFSIYYQSALTNIVVEELLEDGGCGLISYIDSCKLHIPMLDEFRKQYNKIMHNDDVICPIT